MDSATRISGDGCAAPRRLSIGCAGNASFPYFQIAMTRARRHASALAEPLDLRLRACDQPGCVGEGLFRAPKDFGKDLTTVGHFGDPRLATAEKGEAALEIVGEWQARLIRRELAPEKLP